MDEPFSNMQKLEIALVTLARVRETEAVFQTDAEKAAALLDAAISEMPEHQAKVEAEKVAAFAKKQVVEADLYARDIAKLVYAETKDKRPLKGVGISTRRKVRYVAGEAFTWCREFAKTFIIPEALNAKGFENAVLKGTLPQAPATIEEEVQISLASDLSEYGAIDYVCTWNRNPDPPAAHCRARRA